MDEGWVAAVALEQLPDRTATRVEIDGRPVLVTRDGERLFAIGARCTHQGAPLQRGPLTFGALDQVTCPAHGSVFDLADGRVLRGPATQPEPAYDARLTGGTIEVRPRV